MTLEAGVLSTIGNTPLVVLKNLYPTASTVIYGKLEMLNPGGSTKDRTALLMLSKAMENGEIDHNTTVIESSSGNMAIGLALICRYFNLNLIVVTDPKINQHTIAILQAYGAHIDRVTEADPGGNYINKRLARVRHLRNAIPNSYWPNQYSNALNPQAHHQTMSEIVASCPEPPDYILVATGTCGTLMGCASYVREHHLKTKIVAVDAMGSTIFGHSKGRRLIPGHGSGRKSDFLDESCIEYVFRMSDHDCVVGCRRLLQRESILAGGSAGAVVMAAEKIQPLVPKHSTCALIFSDSGERYLDTVYNDSWVEETFHTKHKTEPVQSGPICISKSRPEVVEKHDTLAAQQAT
ncbi:cysteine synthase A [Natronocella acetinitrilica]|uniref:cysteine synthase n=1 Tax=Natronocella acetinitrilica TaxID=414046 RepID=A0AAE3KAJ0_9GAMM|nr:2,3-diaminopropionate biosynthesis protein SbnA [Natronocella acetinitrilica]MCP1673594.1 cysteine synthase A [Natronocella acetinitrilica]